MLSRLSLTLLMLCFMVPNSVKAATCLDVFTGAINDSLLGSGNELINIPPFTGADWYMDSVQTIPLGDSQHMAWYSQQTVHVNSIPVSETSARLYISGGANWVNAKINVGGNPEDLIIILSGSLGISGGQTEINAIIYSRSSITVSGNVTINGAIAAEGSISTTPSVNINYDQNAIENSDFNGMCGNVVPIANYQFDECTYTGVAFEIIDQTGLYPATAFGSVDTNSTGQIERFVDISSENHHLETSIPLPANFSISTWFKKPSSNSDSPYFALGAMQNGGDLLYVDRSNNWRWGVYNPNTGTSNGTFSFATLDNNWHHMAVVYSDGVTQLYIDGVLTDAVNTVPAGTLKYIATSFDDVNGSNPQGFRAPLDEFLVYDIALNAADILTIYDNQVLGNNYDGTARTPVSCSVSAILDYRFDGCSYDGTTGEVIDQLGNYHGTTTGVPDTISDARINQAVDLTATGTSDWIDVPKAAVDGLDDFSLSVWVNTTVSKNTQTIFHALGSSTTDDEVQLSLKDSNRVKFEVRNQNRGLTSAINLIDGAWHHIVVTRVGTTVCLYVDGSQQHCKTNSKSGALEVNNNAVVIGQRQRAYGGNFTSLRSFEGKLDEFKIYDVKLEATDINTIYQNELAAKNYDGTDRALVECNTYVDHFRLDTLDHQGLTCEADEITITACADPTCSAAVTDPYDVDLFVNGVSNHTITVTGGSVTTSYIHTSVGNAALSLAQNYQCTNSNNTPCNVDFTDSAFRFVSVASGTSALPLQLSGKPSNVGYNTDVLKIEAVKTDNSGACAPLLVSGSVIDMAASYQTPSTGTKAVNISGTDIGTVPDATLFSDLPFTGVTLDFGDDTQHSAEYIFTYPDAGAMKIHARYELPDDDGNPSGHFIAGTSNPIVVRPFSFDILVKTDLPAGDDDYMVNPGATSGLPGSGTIPNNPIFTVAGQKLLITYRAVAWKAGDDSNGNGIADENEISAINATTTNYTNETLTSLAYSEVAPIGGITDALNIIDNSTTFVEGIKTDEISYDEVGIISLTAKREKYLLIEGVDIEGYAPYVGRFIPDHFKVTQIIDGDIWAYCNSVDTQVESLPFAYVGQNLADDSSRGALAYEVLPGFVIEARNKKDKLTQNYIETFFKLNDASFERLSLTVNSLSVLAPIEDAFTQGKDPLTKVGLTAILGDGSFVDDKGVITYSYHNNDSFIYHHEANSEVIEFPADIDLSMVSIIDDDLVATLDELVDDATLIFTLHPTAPDIRFGRAQLENSYGPDTSDLPQRLSVNYFTANGYVLSATDTCTTYDSDRITLSNISLDPAKTPVKTDVTGKFSDELPFGETRSIILTAPTTGPTDINIGQVEVIYTISEWLQYDWAYDTEAVDGLFNDNPRAVATFGIYRGNDRIIYQREIAK